MTDVPVQELPVGQDPVIQANNVIDQALTRIGIPLGGQGTPGGSPGPTPHVNWGPVAQQLAYDWPGYPWPATYNAEAVDAIYADLFHRLQWLVWYEDSVGTALQMEANLLYHMIVVLQTDVSALEGSAPTVSQVSGLTGDLASLQNEVQAVAAAAWSNLWGLYNNQVVPLFDRAEADAINNVWSLYHNQVVPLVADAAANANANLWSLYNNQVVPLVGAEAATRQSVDAQLSVSLTQETALRQQQGNTLAGLITNETARATQVESNILGVAIPAAVTSIMTQTEAKLAPIRTELQTCLDPLCDTVTPNAKQLGRLGNLLKGLEGLGVAGLLAGLVTAAVEDPEATATAIVDMTGWIVDLSVSLAQAV